MARTRRPSVEALLQQLTFPKASKDGKASIALVQAVSSKQDIAAVAGLLTHSDEYVQGEAGFILSEVSPSILPDDDVVLFMARHENWRVRYWLPDILLFRLSGSTDEVDAAFDQIITDANPIVRGYAIHQLSRLSESIISRLAPKVFDRLLTADEIENLMISDDLRVRSAAAMRALRDLPGKGVEALRKSFDPALIDVGARVDELA